MDPNVVESVCPGIERDLNRTPKYVVIINIQPWPFSDYLKLPANLKGIQNTNGTVTLYSIAPYWKPCHSAPHSVQYIFLQFP